MDSHDATPLRDDERERYASLSREREPAPHLEERIIAALDASGAFAVRPWYRRSIPLPLAAAAGFLLFAVGTVAGREWSSAGAATVNPPPAQMRVMEAPPDGKLVTWM